MTDEPKFKARSRKTSTGGTSEQARDLMNKTGAAQTIGQMTFGVVQERPSTGEEVFAALTARGIKTVLYSVKPRLSELSRKGLVVDSGDRRTSLSGRAKSVVWRAATPEEVAAFQAKQAEASNV